MLDVDRGVDVDAGGEQLFHVLPALGMARAGDIGVREFVHQQQRRLARERRVEVELVQAGAAVLGDAERQLLQPFEQALGLLAAVRFDVADHDVRALGLAFARGLEHGVGLAHAGAGAEENLELAALLPGFVLLHARQQGVRIGALLSRCGGHAGCVSGSSCRDFSRSPLRQPPGYRLGELRKRCAARRRPLAFTRRGLALGRGPWANGAVMHPSAAFRFAARAARELAPVSHCRRARLALGASGRRWGMYGKPRRPPQVDRRA